MSPCSGCIHHWVFHGLHPVESWCVISGEPLRSYDVWHNSPTALTGKCNKWGDGPLYISTDEVPECKYTMKPQLVSEFGHWFASKLTLFERENKGTYNSFYELRSNRYWLDVYYDQWEVEMENQKRFWPQPTITKSNANDSVPRK